MCNAERGIKMRESNNVLRKNQGIFIYEYSYLIKDITACFYIKGFTDEELTDMAYEYLQGILTYKDFISEQNIANFIDEELRSYFKAIIDKATRSYFKRRWKEEI